MIILRLIDSLNPKQVFVGKIDMNRMQAGTKTTKTRNAWNLSLEALKCRRTSCTGKHDNHLKAPHQHPHADGMIREGSGAQDHILSLSKLSDPSHFFSAGSVTSYITKATGRCSPSAHRQTALQPSLLPSQPPERLQHVFQQPILLPVDLQRLRGCRRTWHPHLLGGPEGRLTLQPV